MVDPKNDIADDPMSRLTKEDLKAIADALSKIDAYERYHKIEKFVPRPKQSDFFAEGAKYRERMFSAGNQLGKSEAGAVEMTYHLTGEYPDDWKGRRWDRPVKAWAAGEGALVVRDVQQKKLFGEPGLEVAFGSGFIPKDKIVGKPSMARGVTDSYDTVHVQHKSGGISVLKFKSYEQGRLKFQGDTIDIIWCDEEPDMDIYTECLARVKANLGMVFTTFTPLKGRTKLYERFTSENQPKVRGFVNMTIYDVPGLTDAEIKADLAQWPVHERETRAKGTPMQGEGRVFMTTEESLRESTIPFIPSHWYKLWALDFGINEDHKFAAALIAWDKDADIIHLLHAFKMADATPLQHAVQIKRIGGLVPVAWPHDGWARERGTGESLIKMYKAQKLKTLDSHATFEDGGYSTEAGIVEMDERMRTGRFKVNQVLGDWFEEYRDYHRKDGQIVRVKDDLMSATRIAVMAKRYARPVLLGPAAEVKPRGTGPLMADGADFSWN